MDFDDFFADLASVATDARKKQKQDEEDRKKREHADICKRIKEATLAGKNTIDLDSYTTGATLGKLRKYCTITKKFGINPSTHDNDMLIGYEIKWKFI